MLHDIAKSSDQDYFSETLSMQQNCVIACPATGAIFTAQQNNNILSAQQNGEPNCATKMHRVTWPLVLM